MQTATWPVIDFLRRRTLSCSGAPPPSPAVRTSRGAAPKLACEGRREGVIGKGWW